jgi:asparagine N-glycosylation enzyme membrane subunit Stt3
MNKPDKNILASTIYLIVIITLISLSSFIKIHNFGEGKLYYSDAALRFHYAEMYSQGTKIPTVDKQVLHPEGLRIRTLIHLTMDWVIGNSHRILFPRIPFTDYVKYFVSIFSSLSILLVFLLGKVIWQKKESGLIAAIFYVIGIASFWRITGNYLREEFALPFIFAALFLFTKAIQSNSRNRHQNLLLIFSGLALAIALISWHLTQFFFTVFIIFLIFFFILNNNQGSRRLQPAKQVTFQDEAQPKGCGYLFSHLWLFLLPILIVGLIWEPISSKYFVFSFPMIMIVWLWLISIIVQEKYRNTILKKTILALSIIPIYIIIIRIFPKYFSEYGHVFETIIAKIIHLGQKPANPALLSFDARSIWMGPFANPGPFSIYFSILVPFILAIIGWLGSINRNFFKRYDYNRLFLSFFIIGFTILYLLVIRLEVFLFFFLAIATGGILNLILEKKRFWRLLLIILIGAFLIESYKTFNFNKKSC